MAGPDIDAVTNALQHFIDITKPHNLSGGNVITMQSAAAVPDVQVLAELEVIEPILNRFYPDWRRENSVSKNYRWHQHREAAIRCLARIQRRAEIEALLGEEGPELAASKFHPWVWDAARPQWESGHHGEAVLAAARNVNSRLQTKLARRDLSDSKLVRQAFSLEPAEPGRPRLRLASPDDSEGYKSLQEGASHFGAGAFQAIRNPAAHDPEVAPAMAEQLALEQLAAFSILARWIEDADLETA